METTTIRMLGKGLTMLCLTLLSFAGYSQHAGTLVNMQITNLVQLTPSSFQYDVTLTNTGTTSLALRGYSWGLNTAPTFSTGGTITQTFVTREAGFAPAFPAITLNSVTANHLRATTINAAAGLEYAMTPNVPVLLGRITVTKSVPFPANYNPFAPVAPTAILQVTTLAGRTQCVATCIVANPAVPTATSYALFGVANPPTATSLNYLTSNTTAAAAFVMNGVTCTPVVTTSSATACDSYTWAANNATYTTSGQYIHTVVQPGSTPPCVDTNILNLTINYSTSTSSSATACDTYTWMGNTYTASGMYSMTSTNTAGCTHTDNLDLTINASTSSSTSATACDTYTWMGNTYTASGMYSMTSTNTAGCTHTDNLDLTINASTTSTSSATACDSYTWMGNSYTASGTYTATSTNAAGCTETATLDLTINMSTSASSSATACDSYTWMGNTYTASGMYSMTSTNAAGCTHTDNLDLTINMSTSASSSATACDSYTWMGNTYTASGMYSMTSTNAAGCTHTDNLDLTINASTTSTSSATACDSYTWMGNSYTASGTYTATSMNAAGCTETATLDLTINMSTSASSSATACDSYTWMGNTYTASGMYSMTSTNAAGCTHTENLDLTINMSTSTTQTEVATGSYTWAANGVTYTMSGTYVHTSLNAAGCVNTATLNLTVNSTACAFTLSVLEDQGISCNGNDDASLQATALPAGSYTYTIVSPTQPSSSNTSGYFNLLEPGTHTVFATDGATTCFQTITFIEPAPLDITFTTDSVASCLGGDGQLSANITGGTAILQNYLTWWTNAAGDTLNLVDNFATSVGNLSAGSYTLSIEDDNGCFYAESATLLAADPVNVTATSSAIACNGGTSVISPSGTGGVTYPPTNASTLTYQVNGAPVAANYPAGTYTVTATDAKGCSSATVITISEPAAITGSSSETACDSYTWNGNTYTTSGTHTATFTAANSCDSVHTLNLTINNSTASTSSATACDSYTWMGNTYTASGMYSMTSLNAAGCTQTDNLDLTINSSTSSSMTVSASGSYTWAENGVTYTASGTYVHTSLNAAGCTNTATLILTIASGPCSFTLSVIEDQPVSCHDNNDASLVATATPIGTYTYTVTDTLGNIIATNTTGNFDMLTNGSHTVYATQGGCTVEGSIFFVNPDPLAIVFCTDSMVSCLGNDGVLSITISGGTANLQDYLTWWTNAAGDTLNDVLIDNFATTVDSLPTGIITVAIEDDNGCFFSASSTTQVADPVVAMATSAGITCSGGTATIVPSGTGGVMYLPTCVNTTSTLTFMVNGAPYVSGTMHGAGTYTITATDAKGCSATTTLTLTDPPPTNTTESVTACDSYTWAADGMTYTTSGTYTATSVVNGCLTMSTLNLTVNYSTSTTTSYLWCDQYTWPVSGMTYTTSGVYTHTTLNANGCVNTATLNLTINYTTVSVTCCVNSCGPYTWNGQVYTASGSYYVITQNASGCPHVAVLCLTVNNPTSSTETATACGSYTWAANGMTYTATGMYTHTTLNAAGCVHTTTLDLTISTGTTTNSSATACDTYTWTANNMTYTVSGMYTHTMMNTSGCVDTWNLDLTINNSTSSSSSITACDSYTWTENNMTYTMGGTYVHTSMNAAGCTNTATLELVINASSSSTSSATACDSYTWAENSMTYTVSGTYVHTTVNAAGCTNTATLNLTINYNSVSSEAATACDSYTWNGTTYTMSGVYTYTSINGAGTPPTYCAAGALTGCGNGDEFIGNVTIGSINNTTTCGATYTDHTSISTNVTPGSTYTITVGNPNHFTGDQVRVWADWNQNGLFTDAGEETILTYTPNLGSGTITVPLTASVGTTRLRVRLSYTGANVPCGNANFGEVEDYTLVVDGPSTVGCVNTATLNLTINNSTTSSETATACDSYTWACNGTTYTTSGTYTCTSLNAAGCVNTATLDLTVNYNSTTSESQFACDSYTWNGTTYTTSGTYTFTSVNASGCTNTATLILVVNYNTTTTESQTACDTYTWNGTTYTVGGTYTYTSFNTPTAPVYCAAGSNTNGCNTGDEVIDSVAFVTIANPSACAATGNYQDFTSLSANVTAGSSYPISVQNANSFSGNQITVWADWNQNGSFLDAGEATIIPYTHTIGGATVLSTGSIAVPAGAINGTTRMRVRLNFTGAMLPCGNTSFGEVEDYTVVVSGGAMLPPPCVNTATLNLTINNSTSSAMSATACDTYTWAENNMTYTMGGTYVHTSLNAAGCTHTATLDLTINASTSSSMSATACDSYTWAENNMTYTMGGTYVHTSLNAAGCTHTATLMLTINASTSSSMSETACDSYTWAENNMTYTMSGTYVHTSLNAAGCTHTATLNLTINNSTANTITTTQCNAYVWTSGNGNTYTVSGMYTHTTLNAAGCVNTTTLDLTINYGTSSSNSVTTCDPYTWAANGTTYTVGGTYVHTLVGGNSAGCDSVATLILTFNNGVVVRANAMLCGAIDATTGLMKDSLRRVTHMQAPGTLPSDGQFVVGSPVNVISTVRGKLPTESLCAADGDTTIGASVLADMTNYSIASNANSIVDWIMLEIRSGADSNIVVATKNGLVQRDGDIVSCVDGTSPLMFSCVCPGDYYVAVKHRNHLGVMTMNKITLSATPSTVIPFSDPTFPVWDKSGIVNDARAGVVATPLGNFAPLWGGDANTNKNVKYNGLSNDKDRILIAVAGSLAPPSPTSNNIIYQQYRREDLNMDGKVRYNNFDNDKNWLLSKILGSVSGATPNEVISQHTPN